MANTLLFKIFIVAIVLGLAGCKTVFPNFPTFFYSQQDLRDQEREIDNSFNRSK
tara:strand:- start:150 stop:311 length:162 start_codon:yes stop_codon:yes gene_type:complete